MLLTGDLRDFGFLMNAPELADGLLIQTVADFLVAQAPKSITASIAKTYA